MIYQKFLNNILELGLGHSDRFAVAFSGGVDSTALLLLSSRYANEFGKNIVAVTIDHGLRVESYQEALSLWDFCASLNVEHVILGWEHRGISNNVMGRARQARYRLLREFCDSRKLDFVITGHHLDDNIENFFIKLSRGSGIKGLVQHNKSVINGLLISRPLFNISKAELIQYVQSQNIAWVEDSSNNTDKYFRNVIRKNLNAFFETKFIAAGLFKRRIVTTQENLASVVEVFDYYCQRVYEQHIKVYDQGFIIIKQASEILFAAVWHEILHKYLPIVSGDHSDLPRNESFKRVINLILVGEDFSVTLHGCNVCKYQNMILIYREFGRDLPQKISCQYGNIWDNRFIVTRELGGCAYIDLMSDDNYTNMKHDVNLFPLRKLLGKYYRKVIMTIPIMKIGDQVLDYETTRQNIKAYCL